MEYFLKYSKKDWPFTIGPFFFTNVNDETKTGLAIAARLLQNVFVQNNCLMISCVNDSRQYDFRKHFLTKKRITKNVPFSEKH